MRYFTQAIGEEDAGRKDMLLDIATEELSHLEVIASLGRDAQSRREGTLGRSGRATG
jgi:Mn-containing catalase